MNPFKYSLSLRFTHPIIKPAEIEAALSMVARVSNPVGEQRKTPNGTVLKGVNEKTFCTFQLSKGDDSELDNQIKRWNEKLIQHEVFLKNFRASGGKIEYFLGVFLSGNSGYEFKRETMNSFCTLGIDLALDLYTAT